MLRSDVGVKGGNPEHSPNSLLWGVDNWLYTSEHTADYRWTRTGLETAKTLSRGQWGLSMDDTGRVFRNWNDDPLRVDYLPGRVLARNPAAVRTRGVYEPVTEDLAVWASRPTPAVNRGYRDGVLRPDGSLAVFQAAGTPTVYRGDRLPADLRGHVFVTEPAGNLVRRYALKEGADGRLAATNAHPRSEFLTSTDERFRPVNLLSAADGTLYIADMYRGVIQHGQYQSEYLKNQIRARGLVEPTGLGRIFRLAHETTRREARPALSAKTPAELVPVLEHPNGWWRDTAQRLLVERGDRSVAPALTALATGARDPRTRLHALWTLDGLGALDAATVLRALGDTAPEVRAAAVRVAEPWLGKDGDPVPAAVRGLAGDRAARVRWQLALSIAAFPEASRVEQAAQLLAQHGRDPFVVDGVVSSLAGLEDHALAQLLARPGVPEDALGPLAGAVARGGRPAAVADPWTRIADARRPVAERLALARGVELALGTESFGVRTPRRLALAAAPQPLLARAHERGEIRDRRRPPPRRHGLAGQAAEGRDGGAAQRSRTAAFRGGQGDLRPPVRGVPSARRPRPRGPGTGARRLAVRHRAGRDHGPDRHAWQGRQDVDATARYLVRRRDRRRADLRATLVRAYRIGGRCRAGARGARLRARPRAPVDRGGVEGDLAAGRRPARAPAVAPSPSPH